MYSRANNFLKFLFIFLVFVLVIFAQSNIVSAQFSVETPLFTITPGASNSAPVKNAEPVNLHWQDFSAQQIADYYTSKGWSEVDFSWLSGGNVLNLVIDASNPIWLNGANYNPRK